MLERLNMAQHNCRLPLLACWTWIVIADAVVHRPLPDDVKPLHPDLVGNGVQRVAVQQVNRVSLLALAGPPVAAGPVRLGVLTDDVQNILREFHWLFLLYNKIKLLKSFNFNIFNIYVYLIFNIYFIFIHPLFKKKY
jgi:hypothetical protein